MRITKQWLKDKNACMEGIKWFVSQKRRSVDSICKALIAENHHEWASWLITKSLDKQNCVRYAIFAAEQVIDIYKKEYPQDDRPMKSIQAARNYLGGKIAAAAAAYAAAAAATAAYHAAAAAAYAAATAATYATYDHKKEVKIKAKITRYGLGLLKAQKNKTTPNKGGTV